MKSDLQTEFENATLNLLIATVVVLLSVLGYFSIFEYHHNRGKYYLKSVAILSKSQALINANFSEIINSTNMANEPHYPNQDSLQARESCISINNHKLQDSKSGIASITSKPKRVDKLIQNPQSKGQDIEHVFIWKEHSSKFNDKAKKRPNHISTSTTKIPSVNSNGDKPKQNEIDTKSFQTVLAIRKDDVERSSKGKGIIQNANSNKMKENEVTPAINLVQRDTHTIGFSSIPKIEKKQESDNTNLESALILSQEVQSNSSGISHMNTMGDLLLERGQKTITKRDTVGVIGSGLLGKVSNEKEMGIWNRLPMPGLSIDPNMLSTPTQEVNFPHIVPTSLFSTPFMLQPSDNSFFSSTVPPTASYGDVPFSTSSSYKLFDNPILREQKHE